MDHRWGHDPGCDPSERVGQDLEKGFEGDGSRKGEECRERAWFAGQTVKLLGHG